MFQLFINFALYVIIKTVYRDAKCGVHSMSSWQKERHNTRGADTKNDPWIHSNTMTDGAIDEHTACTIRADKQSWHWEQCGDHLPSLRWIAWLCLHRPLWHIYLHFPHPVRMTPALHMCYMCLCWGLDVLFGYVLCLVYSTLCHVLPHCFAPHFVSVSLYISAPQAPVASI